MHVLRRLQLKVWFGKSVSLGEICSSQPHLSRNLCLPIVVLDHLILPERVSEIKSFKQTQDLSMIINVNFALFIVLKTVVAEVEFPFINVHFCSINVQPIWREQIYTNAASSVSGETVVSE